MKTITILSGKGGVGKSSIAASLAVLLAEKEKIVAADCDVDAPNLALCLGLKDKDFSLWEKLETSEKAELIENKCTSCKKCLNVCNFNAISWNKKNNKPLIDKFSCEGCGVCQLICPEKAIKLKKVKNGKIGTGKTDYGFKIITGQLEIGESGSGKIVTAVKEKANKIAKKEKAGLILIDSAAGIGCPVIASITGSDYVIAITEPTPAALTDLKRALEVVSHFKIPYGIIINKFDLNKDFSEKIEEFAKKYKITVLGKIPYNKKFVEALVHLKPVVVWDKKFEDIFLGILKDINLQNIYI